MASFLSQYKNRVMVVYVVGLFIQVVDGTIVNIALPTIADDFGVETTDIDWTVIGYYVAVVMVIPIAGFVGDRFGTRRVFLTALAGFTVASALCGTAQSVDQLIAFRMLQGLFAGLITPVGSAMLMRAFPLEERARASAAVITVTVLAPAVGPTLGGLIVETLSWRWIFYVNIPVGTIGLVLAYRWLDAEPPTTTGGVDWLGAGLVASGLGTLLFGISEGPARGWGDPLIIGGLVLGVMLITSLIVVETRIEDPVLALRLLRDRLFRSCNVVAVPTYMAFFSYIFLLPIFLQEVGEHSALRTGLTVSAQAMGIVATSQFAARILYPTFGPRLMLIAGSLAAGAISMWFVTIDETTGLLAVAGMTFLRGIAMGIVFIPIQTATYATIPLPDMGRATSLFNTQRQASVAAGTAVVATILTAMVDSLDSPAEGGAPTAERVEAFRVAFGVSASLFLLAAVLAIRVDTEAARGTMAPRPTRA